ncbi:hypothetical protein JCM14469_14440 [Desulfatiferula olefinivorans]
MIYLSTLLISLFITLSLIPLFKSLAVNFNAVDYPAERKVHAQPVPKIGGLAMAAGILLSALMFFPGETVIRSILAGSAVIVVFGFLDDVKDLGYGVKFLGQILAALVVIGAGGLRIASAGNLLPGEGMLPVWLSLPLTLVVIVGVTNAVNLADGLDGLAGGITMLCFLCLSYVAYTLGMTAVSVLSLAVVGAVFGFLRFNTHPASIFMGDTGSQLLGFLAVTLSLQVSQASEPISPLFPLILLGFPILDTLTVMTGRILKGQSPFKADKSHFHHKLMDLGLSHSEAVFVVYLLQSTLVSLAYVFRFYSEWHLLVTYLGFAGIVIAAFDAASRTGWRYRRHSLIDFLIIGRLKVYRDRQLLIKTAFRGLIVFFLFLTLVTAMILPEVPLTLGVGFPLLALVFIVVKPLKDRTQGGLRYLYYMTVPFVLFLGERSVGGWAVHGFSVCYDALFGVLTVLMLLTLKFTRRRKGFKPTPHDYLVLFVTLCMPLLINFQMVDAGIMKVAVKALVLLFAYEVLAGELRDKTVYLSLASHGMVVILLAKYLVRSL